MGAIRHCATWPSASNCSMYMSMPCCVTASARYIGPVHRNRPHENAMMALLFALALYSAYGSLVTVARWLR